MNYGGQRHKAGAAFKITHTRDEPFGEPTPEELSL